jgi:ABC-type glycerol-3-phosphate transport system substrate-binding protein
MKATSRLVTILMAISIFIWAVFVGSDVVMASKLVYHYNWAGDYNLDDAFQKLIERFRQEHPEITLEVVRGGGADRIDKFLMAVVGGNPPDILHFERSTVIELANKNLLLPLDSILLTTVQGAYLPGAVSEVLHNSRVYALPMDTDIRGLFWNKSLLAEGGYNPDVGPASIEELDSMAYKLTKQISGSTRYSQIGFVPWFGNWGAVGWLYAFGGDIYDSTRNTPVVNTENHVRSFEWIRSYGQRFGRATIAQSGITVNSFLQGQLAMVPHISSFYKTIQGTAQSVDFGVGRVPYPEYGQNGTWMGGYAHVIPNGAKNVAAATIFINWLAQPEIQAEWHRWSSTLPTNLKAIKEVIGELPAVQVTLLEQADEAFGRPPLWSPLVFNTTRDAMFRVANLEESPKIALDKAQQLLEIGFAEVFRRESN